MTADEKFIVEVINRRGYLVIGSIMPLGPLPYRLPAGAGFTVECAAGEQRQQDVDVSPLYAYVQTDASDMMGQNALAAEMARAVLTVESVRNAGPYFYRVRAD